MKKNKMMRTASALLVATLLTTSVISGTFAKYTTTANGKDAARVAKWGVTALVSGDLFGADYTAATDNEISATYTGSVDSTKNPVQDSDKIVAPGTQNTTGVTIAISGTPEVANKVTFENTAANNKDIYLKGGNYGTMVKAEGVTADNFGDGTYYTLTGSTYNKADDYVAKTDYYVVKDTVNVEADYYPIVWSVSDGKTTATYTKVGDMATALNGNLTTTTDNKSLVEIDKSYTITWAWAITNQVAYADGADTILGNLMAKDKEAVAVKTTDGGNTYAAPADTDYSVNVAFDYKITVDQVD